MGKSEQTLSWQDQPTEDGYWWLRDNPEDNDPDIVSVSMGGGYKSVVFIGADDFEYLENVSGKWYGPITPPKED